MMSYLIFFFLELYLFTYSTHSSYIYNLHNIDYDELLVSEMQKHWGSTRPFQ